MPASVGRTERPARLISDRPRVPSSALMRAGYRRRRQVQPPRRLGERAAFGDRDEALQVSGIQ